MMYARSSKVLGLLFLFGVGACSCETKTGDPDAGGQGDGAPNDAPADAPFNPTDAPNDVPVNPDVPVIPMNCGNGALDPNEECDDHNNVAGDACSPICENEPGWDCIGEVCTPSACGDGYKVAPEECDDGNKLSGDGCTTRCKIEANYVCPVENFACRLAVCGNGTLEAQEECDDGDDDNDPMGCSAFCKIQTNYSCPVPGLPCVLGSCGDGVIQGGEECDDHNNAAPGCSASCKLEAGYDCPTPNAACIADTCGNGHRGAREACDDHNNTPDDGCDATCHVEAFYECEGGSGQSVCSKPIEFVRIAKYPAPMSNPQAVHYDPRTRSFYAFNLTDTGGDDVHEFCVNGTDGPASRDTLMETRRNEIVGKLDGAAYDPFRDSFLYVTQERLIYEYSRSGASQSRTLANTAGLLGLPGGVQVGDNGFIYVTDHSYDSGNMNRGRILEFRRNADGTLPMSQWVKSNDFAPFNVGDHLDNIFNISGLGWIGYYNLPNPALPVPNQANQAFTFQDYQGNLIGTSQIPGVLFRNGERFAANADGGEAANDGGYFLVCSEYRDQPTANSGFCQLFAQTCTSSLDCAARVPGTVCKLDELDATPTPRVPYCYAPAVARDDHYTVTRDAATGPLAVLMNDGFADSVSSGNPAAVTSVTPGNHGGMVTLGAGGAFVNYKPAMGTCGFNETFTYTANLSGTTVNPVIDTATVTVTVPCVCGNGVVEPGEECDMLNNTTSGDGCSATCQDEGSCGNGTIDDGEQCDDGNNFPNDECSPTCTIIVG